MCREAEKVQEGWKPVAGNCLEGYGGVRLCWSVEGLGIYTTYLADKIQHGDWLYHAYWDCVWLPRQDQLQEILWDYDSLSPATDIIAGFSKFTFPLADSETSSMEILWLMYVMYEKYNKTWNSKTWEDIS